MEKSKKKRGAKIAAALIALTALTGCFMGSTLARYTSTTDATGTAYIALWKVAGISENGGTKINEFKFGTDGNAKLSPNESGTAGATNEILSEALTITNESDVEADITYAWGDAATYTWSDSKLDTSEYKTAEQNGGTAITYKKIADNALAWKIFVSTDGTNYEVWESGSKTLKAVGDTTSSNSATLYVKVKLVWTTGTGDDRDDIDTILGMYLTSVANTLKLTATQGSQIPNA